MTSRREYFTIWMKSLICNSNGCTVFDSNGEIVYRIDNYDHKNSDEVYVMDLRGNVLFTIVRKKHRVFGRWESYRSKGPKVEEEKPWFEVRKPCGFLNGHLPCRVTVGMHEEHPKGYRIERLAGKSTCKIVDGAGELVADVKQKQSASGVALGDDVLSLMVEPNVDHSLIIGLVVVYGLISHTL